MNRCVGPLLLLGLGLCVASGCAMSGSNRANSFTHRLGWPKQNATADDQLSQSKSSRKEEDRQGIVSFRAPSRRTSAAQDEPTITPGASRREVLAAATSAQRDSKPAESRPDHVDLSDRSPSTTDSATRQSPLLAGHSSDRRDTLQHRVLQPQRKAESSSLSNEASATVANHEEETATARNRIASAGTIIPAIAQTIEPLPDDETTETLVTTANYRSDRDGSENPVTLLGFETIVPLASAAATVDPNEPPLWPNRPSIGSAAAIKSQQTGSLLPNTTTSSTAGPVRAGSQSMGRVQQTSAHSLPPVPISPWQDQLEQLITRVELDLANLKPGTTPDEQAEYRRRHVHLRLLYLMAQRPEQALTAISGLEPAEQEYWQQLCWALSNSLDAELYPLPRDRAAQSIAPLNTALRRLREQADLSIKNMAFCEQISYFGNYQKFAKDEFTPGQEVLLYAEIENFNTSQTADGEHRTLLRSVIDIVGANGEARWHKTFPATEDRCRNPRRDYFHNYQFAIPDRLPLGPHTLKLTVVDDLSGKQASYSLSFLVK